VEESNFRYDTNNIIVCLDLQCVYVLCHPLSRYHLHHKLSVESKRHEIYDRAYSNTRNINEKVIVIRFFFSWCHVKLTSHQWHSKGALALGIVWKHLKNSYLIGAPYLIFNLALGDMDMGYSSQDSFQILKCTLEGIKNGYLIEKFTCMKWKLNLLKIRFKNMKFCTCSFPFSFLSFRM